MHHIRLRKHGCVRTHISVHVHDVSYTLALSSLQLLAYITVEYRCTQCSPKSHSTSICTPLVHNVCLLLVVQGACMGPRCVALHIYAGLQGI